jgi:signal transduction histidine kinase
VPEEAAGRIGWFVRMRWLAVAGVLALAATGRFVLGLRFAMVPFVLLAAGLALCNTVFLLLSRRITWTERQYDRLANIQVVLDILVLTALMHFGGGIENPFFAYYLFHIIIAAILLPRQKVLYLVLLASICVVFLVTAESTGLLRHRHIDGFLKGELYNSWKFVTAATFALISTLWVAAFLASSIVERLRVRDRELAEANVALAEQDRVKSQYVMRVAHDLAEPAGMITSCLKLLTQGLMGPLPDKALDMVERAERKSEYLGHLIKDLLSLSRLRATREIPKADVDVADIVGRVFEEVQPHAEEKQVALQRDIPQDLPRVRGNADAVHELVGNLVTNAVKYTLVGGRVEVAASNTGPDVVVEVRDDGVGIPADAIPHIFEEFYRADNVKAEAVEGTGLGLAIVTQILNAHGGRIWVDSTEGEGTTFTFTLPAVGEADDQGG